MFGDFTWLSAHFNIDSIMNFINTHQMVVVLIQGLSPVITIALYYGSYRVTCHFAGRKED